MISGWSVLKSYHSLFYDNYAHFIGGSVISNESSISIKLSEFQNNTAGFLAGGIACFNSSITIENSSFINNSIHNKSISNTGNNSTKGTGGALLLFWSRLTSYQSVFVNNFATVRGESIFSHESFLLIHGSEFTQNMAGSLGGAIDSLNSSVTIEDSLLKENSVLDGALGNGGGISVNI